MRTIGPAVKETAVERGPRPTIVVSRDDLCLMTHPAYQFGISVRQQARDPFVRAVPMVRIRLPPAVSRANHRFLDG